MSSKRAPRSLLARGFFLLGAALGCPLVVAGSASATPTTPFRECPHVGADTSCAVLIVINDSGTQILTDRTQGPYERDEDTLIGVLNNTTSRTVSSVPLAGASAEFDFDSDGLCDPKNTSAPFSPGPPGASSGFGPCAGNTKDTRGYGGPDSYFTNIGGTLTSGTVNFIKPLAPGQSTYFSLDGAVNSTHIDIDVVVVFTDHEIRLGLYQSSQVATGSEAWPVTGSIAYTDDLHFVVVNRSSKAQDFRIFGATTAAIKPGGITKFERNAPGKGTFAYGSTLDGAAAFHGNLTVR